MRRAGKQLRAVVLGTLVAALGVTVFTASATNDSTSKNFFIPSINVSGQGHAAMGFTTAQVGDMVAEAAR